MSTSATEHAQFASHAATLSVRLRPVINAGDALLGQFLALAARR